jgi:hypothetical protein
LAPIGPRSDFFPDMDTPYAIKDAARKWYLISGSK